ncbi:MAG: N-acetyltransferase [Paludibacteraceae bacterium]|nr:N-acetyltransferase [Paludibacteraceae bacterium]
MTTEIQHTENGESGIFTAWQNDVQVGEMTYKRSGSKGVWNSRGEVVSTGNSERETCCADNNAIGVEGASKRFATEQMVINHTQVFDGFEGQGIARQMVMAALDFARKNNRQIIPVCSYAKAVLTRTDEYQDVL